MSLTSEDLTDTTTYISDESLLILEDSLPSSPLPTCDSVALSTSLLFLEEERPQTSTSTLFSYARGTSALLRTPPPSPVSLPNFAVPEIWNYPGFTVGFRTSFTRFSTWKEQCVPLGDSFASEVAKNKRPNRPEPVIPSLFKNRGFGCGYCKSVGHQGWETHSKQNCQRLKQLPPCKVCGASGEMNHTETYCPAKEPVNLMLSEIYLISSEMRRFERAEHFKKYSSIIDKVFPSDYFF